ncbi:Transcriptional adapter 2 [Nosema granulosis]|uniref:Transcriptional adapter 2 n=1 Tax=Nosema granulosis TaxID=83296 RepID=A0A9P6KZV6_9MICR|nr:Transcriptional adapter 2 [Nosema granulosis]
MSILNTTSTNSVCVVCDFCFLKLENAPLIQCQSCKIDICLHCFMERSETESHSKFHTYKIFNCSMNLDKTKTWSVVEELFFISGIEKQGIGNWHGIAQSISSKTLEEVENHFYDVFAIQHNTIDLESTSVRNSNPYRSIVSVYMPGRRDFDVEYINEEEEFVKDIDFVENEDPDEREFKNTVLECYLDIIKMRENRRYLILSRNLIKMKEIEDKNQHNSNFVDISKYKQLLSLISLNDYNRFLEGLYIEKYLESILKKTEKIDIANKRRLEMVLSQNEKDFCKKNKISKRQFYKIKQNVLKFQPSKNEVKSIIKELTSEISLIDRLAFFFEECGWLKDTHNV